MSGIVSGIVVEEPVVEFEAIEVELAPVEDMLEELVEQAVEDVGRSLPHNANLMLAITDEQYLASLGSQIIDYYEADDRSRVDWKDAYTEALKLLGLKNEKRTFPWPNACGVFHPMITEAIIRFQSTTIMDMFPLTGPCKAKVIGRETDALSDIAERLKTEMNYVTTKVMPEYRTEVEQGLWRLGIAGMVFRKVWFDPVKRRPVAQTIAAEDVVVPFGTSHLHAAPRITHVLRLHRQEVDRMIASGFWYEQDLPEPEPVYSEREEKEGEQQGITPTYEYDDRYTFYEMQIDLNLKGFEHMDEHGVVDELPLPYVVTVERSTKKIMAIRRNWAEGDETYTRLRNMVAVCYIPGWGFYGIGLLNLLSGLAKGATSILRQTIDAGTLANLPAGFKGKGFRVRGDSTPLRPGEFRDIELYSGRIADNIYQLNTKEPSATLVGLMGSLIEEGRRLGAIAELPTKTGEMPVGTIVAMIEHQTKPQSAVQARVYSAFSEELEMIRDILVKSGYQYRSPGLQAYDFVADNQAPVEIVPIADPGAASSAVRILQAQAVVDLASKNPNMYDQPYVHKAMLKAIGIGDVEAMLPDKDRVAAADPLTENMNIMNLKPVKASVEQDHKAHIKAHMALTEDPRMAMIIGQSPNAQQIVAAISSHLAEHAAFLHRDEVLQKLGFPVPMGPMPAEIERRIAPLVAEAASRAAQASKAQAAQQQAQQQAQDPVVQLQQAELELRKQKIEKDYEVDMANVRIKAQKVGADIATNAAKVGDARKEAGARIVSDILSRARV
jgi:hypothetical protein